jgi:hypothetical protein
MSPGPADGTKFFFPQRNRKKVWLMDKPAHGSSFLDDFALHGFGFD